MRGCVLIAIAVALLAAKGAHAQSRATIRTVGHLITRDDPLVDRQPMLLPYTPQPGDIVLYDDMNWLYNIAFKLAHTAAPTHTAIVIAGENGKPALLELTGPRVITARVQIMDVNERFRSYPGTVSVRRIRQPLTPEQSSDLTRFANSQVGKSFAWPRVALLATPFCPRYGLRKELFGHTYLDRNRWYCSELVVAACAVAKIVNGKDCCANASHPRDLAVDQWLDLSNSYLPPVRWTPDVPIVRATFFPR